MAQDLQGAETPPTRKARNGPEWLMCACRCAVCGSRLVLTQGQWVTCYRPGHVGLIGWREFQERILAARMRARTVLRVNLSEHTAIRRAWEIVRGATPATIPPATRRESDAPAVSLFDLMLPVTEPEGATPTLTTSEETGTCR